MNWLFELYGAAFNSVFRLPSGHPSERFREREIRDPADGFRLSRE
jgi:hypothetical protein